MINVTWDAPVSKAHMSKALDWVAINRGKLDRLVLLAAYHINERSGALIERLEESNEGQRPKAKAKARRSQRS